MGDLVRWEHANELEAPRTWDVLQHQITKQGIRTLAAAERLVREGKRIFGYGAPAKMTTLVHAFHLDSLPHMDVADDSRWKQGLRAPGTHWPICSLEELVAGKPDLVVLFAWNFADDLRRRLKTAGYEGPALTPQELAA